MCKVSSNVDVVSLRVAPHETVRPWDIIRTCRRRYFIQRLPLFRSVFSKWLSSLGGRIPKYISKLFLNSEWDDFFAHQRGHFGVRIGALAACLYFMATNDAPVSLRREWWLLLMERPKFDQDNMAGYSHPYVKLFHAVGLLQAEPLAGIGAFHHVRSGSPLQGIFLKKAEVFNIWHCRAFYSEGGNGTRRWVSTSLRFSDDDHNPLDWNSYGMLNPEEVVVANDVDVYPNLADTEEEEEVVGIE